MSQNNANQQLTNLLVSKNFEPNRLNAQGQPAASAEEATMFSFDYQGESGRDYGTVVMMIDEDHTLNVYFGDNLGKGMESDDKKAWFDFLYQIRQFAKRNMMTFSLQNLNKLKYSIQGQAAIKEGIFESWTGRRNISWNAAPTEARLLIKHNKNLSEQDARYRYIESLFIETADGERYRMPFKSLTAGKAMLEHVRQGGKPYDIRGNHISTIVEELNLLSRFRRANQGRIFEGDAQRLVEEATHYFETLKHNLKTITTHTGYKKYFESWNPASLTDEDVIIEDLRHLFVEQNIDSRVEQALPLLAKLKQEHAMKEINVFESMMTLITEGTWALPDTPEKQSQLIKLLSQELPVGADAINATELLYDLLGDDELFDQLGDLARENADADARTIIINRLEQMKDNPAVAQVIGKLKIEITPNTADGVVSEATGSDWYPVATQVGSNVGDVLPEVPADFNPNVALRKIQLLQRELGRMQGLKYEERAKIVAEIRRLENMIQLYRAAKPLKPEPERPEPDEGDPYTIYTDVVGAGQFAAHTLKGAKNAGKRAVMQQKAHTYALVTNSQHEIVFVWYPTDHANTYNVGDTYRPPNTGNGQWQGDTHSPRYPAGHPHAGAVMPPSISEDHICESCNEAVCECDTHESDMSLDEQIDRIFELSRDTLKSYIKKAGSSNDERSASNLASRAAHKLSSLDSDDDGEADDRKSFMRSKGIGRAADKLDELSPDTLGSYVKKASSDRAIRNFDQGFDAGKSFDQREPDFDANNARRDDSRRKGIHQAVKRLTREASDTVEKDAEGKTKSWKHEGDWEKITKRDGKPVDPRGEVTNMVGKELQKAKSLKETHKSVERVLVGDEENECLDCGHHGNEYGERDIEGYDEAEVICPECGSYNYYIADDLPLTESGMSEVDLLLQEIARGTVDIYNIYANPKTAVEMFVQEQLHEKAEEISRERGIDLDSDIDKILQIIHADLQDEYGIDEGVVGSIVGGIGGAALGKSPAAASAGARLGSAAQDAMGLEEVDMGQADRTLRSNPKDEHEMPWTYALKQAAQQMGYEHWTLVPDAKTEAVKALARKIRSGEDQEYNNRVNTSVSESTGDRTPLAGQYGHSGKMSAVEGVDADMMERIKFLAGLTK